jgi:hypothetical protein
MLGSTTGPLVHADDVASCAISFLPDTAHVVRLTATFKAMDQDDGRTGPAIRLPMAKAEQLRPRFYGKEARFIGDPLQEPIARPVPRHERHEVSISEGRLK